MESNHGFTLIEMILVISVIAITIALSVPNLRDGKSREEVKSVARELSADIRYAQTLSISQKVEETNTKRVSGVGIYLTKSPTQQYLLFEDHGNGIYDPVTDRVLKTVVLDDNVSIEKVEFNANPGSLADALTLEFRKVISGTNSAGSPVCYPTTCTSSVRVRLLSERLEGYTRDVIIHATGVVEVI